MKIEAKEQPMKIVYYWMSHEEGNDEELMASLRPQFREWKAKGYLPAVFVSGTQKLEDVLYLLMKNHYEKLAKKQLIEEGVIRDDHAHCQNR